ncbi:MAG: hypothetical protein ABI605_21670 [Rhizobacter sp.]
MSTATRCINAWNLTAVAIIGSTLLMAGCATRPLDAQWADPQLASGNPLRGARVLVVCEAQDLVLRRVCQDQMGAQILAAGATPVAAPDAEANAAGNAAQYVAAAKAAGAKAVMVTTLSQDSSVAKPGFSIGFGLGGGLGGGGFGGLGVSAPIGGTRVATGYAANSTITDAESGRLVWTARASTPPSDDLNAQVADLAKTMVAGAGKAGLF